MSDAVRPSVSVCMATYNGEKFLHEQVASILVQLTEGDELVVVDDCSTDKTVDLLRQFGGRLIKVLQNERNLGVNATFERAVCCASNEIIFLADQDDIWIEGRVDRMCQALINAGALVVSSNSYYIDARGEALDYGFYRLKAADSCRHLLNIIRIFLGRAPYFGCAMAFRRKMASYLFPLPRYVESHDLWIALASNLLGSNVHLDDDTLMRRVHGGNASIVRRSLPYKFWSRVVFALSLGTLYLRYSLYRKSQ